MLLFAGALLAADTLQVFGYRWSVPDAADWSVAQEDGVSLLHLVTPRGPVPGPRRPIEFALADTPEYEQVTVEADVRPLKGSLMIVFAYRDAAHFDYAHLSADAASKQPVHNGIFHVYGGERVRISSEAGPAAFATINRWYHVRLAHDGASGHVQVAVDQRPMSALDAVDLSLRGGRVGLGSFDETADFKNVRITGTLARTEPITR